MKNVEDKERFIELRAEGRSYADIAAVLKVSKPTLIAWSKELSLEVQNARNLRLDVLFEKYAVAKTKRVEVFGKRLDAILKELDTRDLKEVGTPTLLALALKYGENLREEYVPLKLSLDDGQAVTDWGFGSTVKSWEA